jgi:hypothetical protein
LKGAGGCQGYINFKKVYFEANVYLTFLKKNTNMKNKILAFSIAIITLSCTSKKHTTKDYFTENQQDTLVANIITHIYTLAPGATRETKFQPQFKSFYTRNIQKFSLQNYQQAPDGWHYFFMIRPVGASSEYKRGVLGKFKLEPNSLMPEDFEEIANTPHLKEEVLKERGQYLFQELIKNGNLDKQLPMKHYVEWPDEHLAYDKKVHEWKVIKPY